MKRIEVHNTCTDFQTYRAARVKSLFNAESGANFDIVANLPVDEDGWSIGVVVGASGTGKSSIGRAIWGAGAFFEGFNWDSDAPIVDDIAPQGDFKEVTGALAKVGLGDVPAWLRPYHVLSTGQRFRADLARILAERPDRIVVDEFTSVVDRQTARVGAAAFARAWRKTGGQVVLLTCHYDILDWIEPDWVFDTNTSEYLPKESLQYERPRIELEVREGGWGLWPYFEPHHYLKAGNMPAGRCYVGFVEGKPVAHLGVSTSNKGKDVECRLARFVVLPEWQGVGIGTALLNHVCDLNLRGEGRIRGRRMTSIIATSHPALIAYLNRSPLWKSVSSQMHGGNRSKSRRSLKNAGAAVTAGYGGHFRSTASFRYHGHA